MERRGNRLFIALGTVAAVGLLLLSFLVIWLLPRGPENSEAQGQNPGASAPASGSVAGSSSTADNALAGTSKSTYAQVGGTSVSSVSDQAHITVHGTGSVSAKPDMATVQVGVQIQNNELSAAQTEAANKMDAIMKQLKAAGIDDKDIATSQYSVDPVMNYPDNQPPQVTGYRVTNVVSVKVHDLTKAGSLIDSLVGSGANTLYGISFGFSNPDALMNQAREAAMKDARAKAEQLAKLGSVTLGNPIVIEDGGSNVPPTPMVASPLAEMGKSTAASTPINPGQQEIRADVSVIYSMK